MRNRAAQGWSCIAAGIVQIHFVPDEIWRKSVTYGKKFENRFLTRLKRVVIYGDTLNRGVQEADKTCPRTRGVKQTQQ